MRVKTNKNLYASNGKRREIMLTKSNKVVMNIISIVTIILGLVTAIPFRTLPVVKDLANVLNVEFIVKFIVIPVLALGLSVYPNILKYRQIKNRQERSKAVNILSYHLSCN